jgi:hypothetical protein
MMHPHRYNDCGGDLDLKTLKTLRPVNREIDILELKTQSDNLQ